jgi:hypothetical protein
MPFADDSRDNDTRVGPEFIICPEARRCFGWQLSAPGARKKKKIKKLYLETLKSR